LYREGHEHVAHGGGIGKAKSTVMSSRGRTAVLATVALICSACSSAGPPPQPSTSRLGQASTPATTVRSSATTVSGQPIGQSPSATSGAPNSAAGAAAAPATPPPPTAAHPFLTYTITGAASGIRSTVLVRLPPAYFDPRQATRRFPVIETFHGSPGHAPQWIGKMRLGTVLDAAAAAHQIADTIVVSPNMNYPTDGDRECVDSGDGQSKLETWATQDVPAWVDQTFRARTDRNSWATIGLSAGGWCAAMATMLHPDRYSAAIVMAGYFRPLFTGPSPFTVGGAAAHRYDLVALATQAPPAVAVWLETSPKDPDSYSSSMQITRARPPLAVTATVLTGQDHSWSVWHRELPTALAWLAKAAPGFASS
jgi:enterochelin esterase-like enzyme